MSSPVHYLLQAGVLHCEQTFVYVLLHGNVDTHAHVLLASVSMSSSFSIL